MIDVAIVGAGAAGLAAGARLRRHGLTTHILEATGRPGGRARTVRPPLLRGAWLDEGAAWLHAPERNPLVVLARGRSVALVEAFSSRLRKLFADGRLATERDERDYERAENAWHDLVLADTSTDRSLAEAAGPFRRSDRWAANVEHWEATIIAAADPDLLGVADWHANELPWGDLQPADGGLGDLVVALLGPDAGQVTYGAQVEKIDRTDRAAVRLETSTGSVEARAVILTVSTGVLRAETIRHDPPLPARMRDAIARLPMGLLSRVVLQADPDATDRLDFASGESGLIERRLTRPGEPAMIFGAWPRGGTHLIAFHGGRLAWSLAGDGAAANRMARDELAALYGAERVERLFAPGFHATGWGSDRHFLGAYAYAGPGDFPARAALAEPIDDRLVIAGEATDSEGLAGTVGGAVRSGERAADAIAKALHAREGRFTPAPKPV